MSTYAAALGDASEMEVLRFCYGVVCETQAVIEGKGDNVRCRMWAMSRAEMP